MKLSEPTTAITDLLIDAEALYLGSILLRSDQLSVAFWGVAFYLLAASAAAGALYHASTPDQLQPFRRKLPFTIASLMLLALTFMFYGGVVSSFTGGVRTAAFVLVHLALIFAFLRLPRFMGTQKQGKTSHAAIAAVLFFFFLILAAQVLLEGPEAGTWIVVGGIVCMTGAWVQQSRFRLQKHMNHNDIAHLFLMAGIYLLYRGASLMLDQ